MIRPLLLILVALLLGAPETAAQELPRVLIQRGERFLAMGNLDAAQANYDRVVACCGQTPEGAEAHNDLGVIWARRGDLERAVAEYEAALAINGYPLAVFNLAEAWKKRYEAGHDPACRDKALAAFQAFDQYLRKGDGLPPVVLSQREEIKAYVRQAVETLRQ